MVRSLTNISQLCFCIRISDGDIKFLLSGSCRLTPGEKTTILVPLTHDAINDEQTSTIFLSTYNVASDDELDISPSMKRKRMS